MQRRGNAVRWRTAFWVMFVLVLSPLNVSAGSRADGCVMEVLGNDAGAIQATEKILSSNSIHVPGDPLRTTSRLTMPAGAVWVAAPLDGTMLLILDSGKVCATLSDGIARISRPPQSLIVPRGLETVSSGEWATLWTADRLVMHGTGTLSVRNVGDGPATATLIRVAFVL